MRLLIRSFVFIFFWFLLSTIYFHKDYVLPRKISERKKDKNLGIYKQCSRIFPYVRLSAEESKYLLK